MPVELAVPIQQTLDIWILPIASSVDLICSMAKARSALPDLKRDGDL